MAHVRDQWYRPSASGSSRERTARYGVGRRWLASYQDSAGRRHAKSFDRKVDAERYLALTYGSALRSRAGAVVCVAAVGRVLLRPAVGVKVERPQRSEDERP